MVIAELCAAADSILEAADIADREFDRQCIFEDIGGMTRAYCYAHSHEEVSPQKQEAILAAVKKRAEGCPLQYILGAWEFYGQRLKVGEGVLIPRADTEALVEAVLARLNRSRPVRIIDLCSGSGCIAAALAHNLPDNAEIFAVEKYDRAYSYLRENVGKFPNVKPIKGDVLDRGQAEEFNGKNRVDCIVSNPPYLTAEDMTVLQKEVRYEPETALYGGEDGLYFYREIITLWCDYLRIDGLIAFEIDPEQESDVGEMLVKNGFEDCFTRQDGSGSVRVIGGYRKTITPKK
ncbi:MAG: peptide chain release factor N(5)-glutamine methyltransferase [Oscillospiraceae bacterium]|nr:peptide chain release factor N(5)-glutamine methyltransferase [Oscillospiraceae bacterium]